MKYEVALSFAGEEREFVKEVARHLKQIGITYFYDAEHEAEIWGQSLAEFLQATYEEDAGYVVMFVSSAYLEKTWTNLERRSAISGAVARNARTILPFKFETLDVPGLPGDVAYLSAKDHTPATLAARIAEKLGRSDDSQKRSDLPAPSKADLVGEVQFDYSSFNGRFLIGRGLLEFETSWSKASDRSIHVYNDPPSIRGLAIAKGHSAIEAIDSVESLDFTSQSCTPQIGQIVILENQNGFYAALEILEIKDDTRGAPQDWLRFRYVIQSDMSGNFANGVVDN